MFSLPVIGAIIGWMANRIALRMLFRPRNPINIFGFKIQGVFPKRRTELAHAIGHTVQKEFGFHNDIKEILTDDDSQSLFVKILEKTQGAWAGDDWPETEKRQRKIELAATGRNKAPW